MKQHEPKIYVFDQTLLNEEDNKMKWGSYTKFTTGGLIVTYSINYNKYIIFLNKYPIITLVHYSDDIKVIVG